MTANGCCSKKAAVPAGTNYAAAIRNVDEFCHPFAWATDPSGNLSPDGKWAASVYTWSSSTHHALFPWVLAEIRQIFLPELESIQNGEAHFLPDGRRLLVRGNEPGRPSRDFLIDLSQSKPKAVAITREAQFIYCPSPDGKYFITVQGKNLALFPANGNPPIALPLSSEGVAVQWSADSRALWVTQKDEIPLKIYRMEVATGAKTFVRELTPADRAGVVSIDPLIATPDDSVFAYSSYY